MPTRPPLPTRALLALLWLGLIWLWPAASFASAQEEPSAPAAEPFFEAVDVEIINIDVWVTDRDGEPIEGLSRDDFVVYRDRQPVEITNFFAVAAGRPVSEPAEPRESAPAAEAPVRSPLTPIEEVPSQHRLWLIAYFDNLNLHPIERNRVLPEVERFLGRAVTAGGQVMIVSYDRALEVRQPFTNQLSAISATLEEIKDESGMASIRRRDQATTLRQIDNSEDPKQALLLARFYAEEQASQVRHSVAALDRLIETLGGLPGRKALVHVSSGVPMLAGEEMFHAVAEKFGATQAYSEIPRHDTTREFESLDRRANAHRVAFYTLDAGGLRGFQYGAAEYGGFVSSKLRGVLDSIVPENLQAPLRLMAQETGGRSILNTNLILPALDEVSRDFQSFYSLGIPSVDADSGRYHDLKVELREPSKGVTLRHRAGYRSKSLRTRVREQLRSGLLYAHQENPLDLAVEWGAARREPNQGNYVLPIRLELPLRDIALLPVGEGTHEARLELLVAAAGFDGRTSEIDVSPFGVRLADENVEAARGEALVHFHKILLEGGRQKVGVAVLDVFGSQSSVVTGIVQVGPAQPSVLEPD